MRITTPIRAALTGATVLTLALTLGACDPGDESTDPPTDATTSESPTADDPTTTESDEPTEPATTREPPDIDAPTPLPEIAQDDANGAASAALYFLRLYDYMRATGDTSQWEALSADDCDWCAQTLADTTALHDEGGWIDGEMTFDISEAEVEFPRDGQDFYGVRLTVVQEPFVQIQGDGTEQQGDGATLDPMAIGARWEGDRFQIVAVNFEVG